MEDVCIRRLCHWDLETTYSLSGSPEGFCLTIRVGVPKPKSYRPHRWILPRSTTRTRSLVWDSWWQDCLRDFPENHPLVSSVVVVWTLHFIAYKVCGSVSEVFPELIGCLELVKSLTLTWESTISLRLQWKNLLWV